MLVAGEARHEVAGAGIEPIAVEDEEPLPVRHLMHRTIETQTIR